MSGRRWSIWLGLPTALVAIALVVGLRPGAEAGGRVTPRPAGACPKPMPTLRGLQAVRGTWWRLADRLDQQGSLAGRTLFAGQGGATNLTLELGPETAAGGPVGGIVVVATNDGTFSDVLLVSVADGCSWRIHRSRDVVRSAILDTSSGSVLAHLVSREGRDDKGTWRISGMDPDATLALVLDPLPLQPELGQVWATELRMSKAGNTLAVQSCGETACLTRLVTFDSSGGAAATVKVGGADQGTLVGFTDKRLITWAQCQGVPCAVQAWTPGAARPETLVDMAVGAAVTEDGRYLVAVLDATGRASRLDLNGMSSQRVQGVAAGDLPLGAGISACAGFEVGPDEVALAAAGADPHAFNPSKAALAP